MKLIADLGSAERCEELEQQDHEHFFIIIIIIIITIVIVGEEELMGKNKMVEL